MRDTGGDWARRHARLGANGGADDADGERGRVVSADPPEDDWSVRHAWCRRS